MKSPERDWYRFAEMDFQSAKTLHDHSSPKPLEIICYLSQQSVEKLLKGFLVAQGTNPPRTHNLPHLCDMCIDIDKRFLEIIDVCEFLTLFGVQPRYPNEIEITYQDTIKSLSSVKQVFDFYKKTKIALK